MLNNKLNSALVFGMFETGLGVSRSLGRKGIKVFGYDYKKDIASYSRYVKFSVCPNPLHNKIEFTDYVLNIGKSFKIKPVIFITSDEYIEVFSENRKIIEKYFLINLPSDDIIKLALNKNLLYARLNESNIKCPKTYTSESDCNFPVLIKADNVNDWRMKVSGNNKVFIANNLKDLTKYTERLTDLNVKYVLQELIPGDDSKFYKYCAYRTSEGEIISEFMLRKIRQNPVHFGVGSLVVSVYNKALKEIGRKVLKSLDYKGVVSVEFKYDDRDNEFKLIEINARYWQQNMLPTKCGINFPLTEYDYLANNIVPVAYGNFKSGVKWINIYMDFSSFLKYRKNGEMTLFEWIDDIKGEKVYSDFAGDDLLPGFYEIFLSNKAKKIPNYFFKNI